MYTYLFDGLLKQRLGTVQVPDRRRVLSGPRRGHCLARIVEFDARPLFAIAVAAKEQEGNAAFSRR